MSALQRFGTYPLYISTPIAAIIAAVVTGLAHLIIGDLFGGIPSGFEIEDFSGNPMALEFYSSMFSAFLYTLIGGVVYAIVRRFASNPDRIFIIIAAVVTVLSFIQPFTIEDGPGRVIATLIVLHIIAAVVAVPALITLTRPKSADQAPAESTAAS